MRWILASGLLLSLIGGSGNLQERLSHRVSHGWLVTVLEIDRDVVLSRSEKHLLAVLRVEPPGPDPVPIVFEDHPAAVFWIESMDGAEGSRVWWRKGLVVRKRTRLVTRSGWQLRTQVPIRDEFGKSLPGGQYLLRVRLRSAPALENSIGFRVR